MEEKNMNVSDLCKISTEAYNFITQKLEDERGEGRAFDVLAVLAIVHRMLFARIECEFGIDEARMLTEGFIELVEKTFEEGAWDFENERMK
jgi:hypothetical protein